MARRHFDPQGDGARKTFSTLEISRMCHVDPVTVARWCDQGQIKCFRTPGGHRRILQADLIDFFRRQRIPLPAELSEPPLKVLIVGGDADLVRALKAGFKEHRPQSVIDSADNGVEAVLKIGTDLPDVVIFDLALPKIDGAELCRRVKENAKTRGVRIVAVAAADRRKSDALVQAGALACLPKSACAAEILALLALPLAA